MFKPNQRGYGTVAVLWVAAAVVVVSLIGLLVNHQNQTTASKTNQSQTNPNAATTFKRGDDSIKVAAEKLSYSTVPVNLQKAILQYTQSTVPNCVMAGKIVDANKTPTDQEVDYAGTGTAITPIGCDGAAATLFIRHGAGQWVVADKTQFGFSCNTLKANKVPVELLTVGGGKAQCDDGTTGLVAYTGK